MRYDEPVHTEDTDLDYFLARVHVPASPCWIWRGYIRDHGYGVWGKKPTSTREAHRRSYELHVGPIPTGMEVHHRCFNRSCVNPEHLELLAHHDNLRESRSVGAVNSARTHCVQGHPFDDENTLIRVGPNGQRWRQCRTCRNDATRKIAERKRREIGRMEMSKFCKNGHPRTVENTEFARDGSRRRCRLCRQEQKRRARTSR